MNFRVAPTSLQTVLRFSISVTSCFVFSAFATPGFTEPACGQDKAPDKAPPQVVEKQIIFIGDSLAAGYGVKKEEAFPELVGELLRAKGHKVRIINGGIAGSVSKDADRRVKWYLKTKPQIIVLELGANDSSNGTPPKTIKQNLAQAIDPAKANNIKVLLLGMKVYTNYGTDYAKEFEGLFQDLAKEKSVPLMPFVLEDVALEPKLNQADRRHPNAEGHKIVAKNLLPYLEKLL